MVIPHLAEHLAEYVDPDPDALVFAGPKGAPIRRSNFHSLLGWTKARAEIGVPGLHFHDLRHTGNTLAAGAGASTKDLMARMGHDSVEAALIYQHATSEADRAVADKLNDRLMRERGDNDEPEDGCCGCARARPVRARGGHDPKIPLRNDKAPGRGTGLSPGALCWERVTGIEPAWPAWKAGALPLSYTRVRRPRTDGAQT